MRVVADIEANGFLDTVDTVWCVVLKDIDTGQVHKFTPDLCQATLPKYLDECSVVIGHNFLDYDIPVLKKVLGYEFPKTTTIIDTYILDQMIEPDRRKHPRCSAKKGAHSLENFGCIFKRYKPEHEDWTRFSPEMLHRCKEDVEINYQAFRLINKRADIFNKNSVWYNPYRMEAAFAECLVKQKVRGFVFDVDEANRSIDYFTRAMARIDKHVVPRLPYQLINHEKKDSKTGGLTYNKKPFKGNGDLNQHTCNWCDNNGYSDLSVIAGPFSRISIEPFDLGKRSQLVPYLLDQGWIPDQWNTKTDPITGKEVRTSPKLSKDDNFNGVQGSLGKLVARRTIIRHRRSQLEGFLKIIRPDGRITADSTGLTPTARLKHKGLVNVPNPDSGAYYAARMRRPFTVAPGYVLVGCDAASCQLRNLCHHMGDPEYTDAVINGDKKKGTDIHSLNMKATGIEHRSKAKNFIYGFLFGAGNAKIGSILGSTTAEGKKVRDRYYASFPKLKDLLDRLAAHLRKFKFIPGLDGREVYPRAEHEALVYLLQSDEAILMKCATVFAHKWIEREGLEAYMVCHMHDEYQWEVRKDHAERVAELLELAIVKAGEFFNMTVPMAGEAGIGANWGDTH